MSDESNRSRQEHGERTTDRGVGTTVRKRLGRRPLLKALGVAGAATVGSWSTVGNAAAKSADNSESSFPRGAAVRGATIESLRGRGWDVVNVVEQGVDNSGETPVQDEITALIEDDTVLVFPDGEYLFQGGVSEQESDHLAFIGEPGATPQLIVGDEFDANELAFPHYSLFTLGFNGGGSGIIFWNLEINLEGDGIGAGGIQLSIKGDGGYLKDIDFVGENDSLRNNISFEVPDEDAVISIHDVRMPDGGSRQAPIPPHDGEEDFKEPPANECVGIIGTVQTTGEVHIGNCVVGGFPNNGVYTSKVGLDDEPGKVIVRGGEFFNNDRDQLRVGAQSEIHNAYCYSDNRKRGFKNLRGIWVRHADGVLIKNTTIEQMTSDPGDGIRISNVSGKTTVRNTSIRLNSPGYGIWAQPPDPPTGGTFARPPGSEAKVVCKNVSITGSAAGREAVRIEGRDGSEFKNCCVDLSGGDRDGFVFLDSDATVYNAGIDVTGEQIVAENSDVETHNIREKANCPHRGRRHRPSG